MGAKSDLKDGYFWGRSSTDVIADLAAGVFTLAGISALQSSEQKRIGWSDNPTILTLYSLTSAGVWIARTSATGRLTEENSGTIMAYGAVTNHLLSKTVTGDTPTSAAAGANYRHRMVQIPLTEAGGSIAATAIVPGIASYKARCIIRPIWAPTGTTDAANTWSVTSEAGGNIIGPSSFVMNLTALRAHWPDAGASGVSGQGILVYNDTADKDILLSAADLAAVGTTYYVEVEYWYEV